MTSGPAGRCAHCALPTARPPDDGPAFCCVGCRLADAVSGAGEDRARGLLEARLLLASVLAMGVMTFSLVLYGEDLHEVVPDESFAAVRNLGRAMLALFALPVLALLAPPLVRGAIDDLRARRIRMDGLIVLSVLAAYGLSLHATWTETGDVYFETATMVLVLVTFGRRLEARARTEGRDAAAALAAALPEHTTRIDADGERPVPSADVCPGDVLLVRPGETVPTDGVVLQGRGEVDRAQLTGEHAPLPVGPGDAVLAGSVNGHAALRMRADGRAVDSRLAHIQRALDAPLQTTRRQRLVDTWAGRLALVAMVLACTSATWAARESGLGSGLRVGLSVLLVSCPCAFGLAMPLAYRSLRVALARRGVLVHDAAQLERAAHVDTLLLDKTGTLTDVRGSLAPIWTRDRAAWDTLRTLVAHSGHALAAAVTGPTGPAPDELRVVPGAGVDARVGGDVWRAGRPGWLADAAWPDAARTAVTRAGDATLIACARAGQLVALGRVDQRLRPEARAVLDALRARVARVEILSGDGPGPTAQVAEALGVAARGELDPEGKRVVVDAARADGATVLMAGDGINDGPALAGADVSLAMGSGTATARAASGLELLRDDLHGVAELFDAARVLRRTVQGNLAWAVAYNGVALALAASGRLHPLIAVAAMIVSSVVVSLRSARLLDWRPDGAHAVTPTQAAAPARDAAHSASPALAVGEAAS